MNHFRMSRSVLAGLSAGLLVLAFSACGGGNSRDPANKGVFQVNSISTGRGAIYPYRIRTVDSFGNPTTNVINIDSIDKLKANVNGNNGVLPVATFSTVPDLPDGNPGNHFLHFTFSHKLDPRSVISESVASQTNSALTGALNVLAYDPATEATTTVTGRAFVGGFSVFNLSGNPTMLKAVEADGDHVKIAAELRSRGAQYVAEITAGFPNFPGSADLVDDKSFVFVADNNNNLASFDTFPNDKLLRLVATNSIRDTDGRILKQEVVTATTVGADPNPPQVLGYTSSTPNIAPGNGQTGIDPRATIQIRFNKPVQPGLVGSFFDPNNFTPPIGGITLNVTEAAQTFQVIYHADPVSFGNLCDYVITPAYTLPGTATVGVTVQNTSIRSLTNLLVGQVVATTFVTAEGPGIINAPVAPEAIYVGIGGATPGVGVIDLNGFGQGTIGQAAFDNGESRWPRNPNIGISGVVPPLAPGTGPLDGGGRGVLTLTQDTTGNTRLLRDPIVGDVTDIHIGAPLDLVFNNENINVNATRANQINPVVGGSMSGNTITQPPQPNPPRLIFPPPNPNRAIFGEEPTVTSSTGAPGNIITTSPPCAVSPLNLLVQGNPFANQQGQIGTFGTFSMGTFYGPNPPPTSPPPPQPFCPFTSRQQIGHFLYVLDRDNRQVLVVNSNRFTVLATIPLTDPVSMAMAPMMTHLAVTNFSSATVSFIDINPLSNRFNQVVAETRVERGPTGLAWQPDGEDILVVSTGANLMSIISARDFTVRRTVSGFLSAPIDVCATERFANFGFASNVYYAYILNSNGSVAVYESGPDGVNGFGFNDVIGTVANATFSRANSMIYNYSATNGGVYIGHVDDQGLGQVSRLDLTAGPVGQLPLNPNSNGFILPPTFRQKEWTVTQKFGGLSSTTPVHDLLSGNSIIDLCTDEVFNFGAAFGQTTQFNLGFNATPYRHSGKHSMKVTNGLPFAAFNPKLLFVALSDVGKVDVIELQSGRRVASIDVPGVRVVSSYWRQ